MASTIAPAMSDEPTDRDGFPEHEEDRLGPKGTDRQDDDADFDDMPEGMDDEAYRTAIAKGIEAAEDYIDSEVSPDRELAARYYAAELFGNEQSGRSQVVSPEVRGAVLGHMPGLMRMFAGTERFIEFAANPGTPDDQAEMQTDYVNHILMEDNNGYAHFQAAIDDALRRKTGIFTWWWEEKEEVTRTPFSGLNEDAFALLQMEATDKSDADLNLEYDVEVTEQEPDELQDGGSMVPENMSAMTPEDQAAMQAAGMAPPEMYLYSGFLRRRFIKARARFRAVPPEEFIITPTSSSDIDKWPLVGTREEKTISEIVALGHDEAEVRDLIGGSGANNATTLNENSERLQRNNAATIERLFDTGFGEVDPSSEFTKYCVVYVLIDKDNDGIAERRKIVTVGDNNEIIYDEIWDGNGVPFGLLCPYPEPHAPFGMSVADLVMDHQEVKSELIRGTLDSLAESISTRLAFWQGKVNVDDILNTERGAAIRTNDIPSNVIQNIAAPFVGQNTMPIIQYMDEDRNKRTGTNPANPTGFDPDSTQSTAREAIGSMIDASQERTEYIARNMAETGFKRLFIGVRNLTLQHQDHRRVIRLNGEDVTFDPRTWNSNLDTRALVGVGRSNGTKKIMALKELQAMQKEVYMTYGPDNPIVTLQHISHTTSMLIRAMGFANPYQHMGRVTPEVEDQLRKQAAEKAAQPTPEQMLYQASLDKNAKDLQGKMAMAQATLLRAKMADDTARDKAEQQFAIDTAKILGDFGIKIDEAEVRRQMAVNDQASQLANGAVADNTPQQPEAAK